jgi:homoserine O-acetyltransferase
MRRTRTVEIKTFAKRGAVAGILLGALSALASCGGDSPGTAFAQASSSGAAVARLTPLPGKSAPRLTKKSTVRMQTTGGEVVIEVYPEAAPNSAARFIELVRAGYFDDTPVSRVVPGFVAQFGVNWRPPHNAWKERTFNEDPTLFALETGTLAFAKTSVPNSASTQVFINYADNSRLASQNFTVFGKVVSGMDVVTYFTQVGSAGGGLDQERLWRDGGAYLESLPVKPTMIVRATVE